jgi:hypothetical protein
MLAGINGLASSHENATLDANMMRRTRGETVLIVILSSLPFSLKELARRFNVRSVGRYSFPPITGDLQYGRKTLTAR